MQGPSNSAFPIERSEPAKELVTNRYEQDQQIEQIERESARVVSAEQARTT